MALHFENGVIEPVHYEPLDDTVVIYVYLVLRSLDLC